MPSDYANGDDGWAVRSCFADTQRSLISAGGAARVLVSQLDRLWRMQAPLETLWDQVDYCREYWACIAHGDVAVVRAAMIGMAAVLLDQGVDGRVIPLLRLTLPYGDGPDLRTLAAVGDRRGEAIEELLGPALEAHDRGAFAEALEIYASVHRRWPNVAWPIYEQALSTLALEHPAQERGLALLGEALSRDPFYGPALRLGDERKFTLYETDIVPCLRGDVSLPSLARFADAAFELHERWSAAHAYALLMRTGSQEAADQLVVTLTELGISDFFDAAMAIFAERRRRRGEVE